MFRGYRMMVFYLKSFFIDYFVKDIISSMAVYSIFKIVSFFLIRTQVAVLGTYFFIYILPLLNSEFQLIH